MANELRHADVGTALSKSEWEAVGTHVLNSQAAGDVIYASSTSQLSRLGIGSANQFLTVNSGASAPEWTSSPKVNTAISPVASDGATLGTAALEWSDLYLADAAIIYFGDDDDVTLTHVHNDGLLLSSTDKLQFGDAGTFIHQSSDGVLTIESDTTVDINGAVAFNGAITGATNITLSGELDAATLDLSSSADIAGDLVLSGGADGALQFTNAGENSIKIPDNQASALIIEEANNAYITFDTRDSAEKILVSKAIEFDGALDIDAAIQADGTVTVGVNDTGYDVKFFGATSGQYLLWDESADELVLAGDSKLSFHDAAGGENIIATSDGHLEVNAGTTLDITAPTVDLNSATEFNIDTAAYDLNASGATTITGGSTLEIDAAGALTVESSGGAISIAGDNIDQTVNIATAGTRTLNIGIDDGTDATTLNVKAPIRIDTTPTNLTVSGITALFTAGEALDRGEVVYFKQADSKMWKAVATAAATSRCVAMAAEDISADAAGLFLLQGFCTDSSTFVNYSSSSGIGVPVYTPEAETTVSSVDQNIPEKDMPASDGDFVQIIGWVAGASTLYFNPSNDIIEHAG